MTSHLFQHRLLTIVYLLPLMLFLLSLLLPSAASTQCQGPPNSAPTLSATPGNAKVTLTWSAVSDATGYYVYRSDNGGAFGPALPLNGPSTSFEDTRTFSNGSTYAY